MGDSSRSAARWSLVGLIVALAVGFLVYRLLVFGRLEQTAALFVGLPAFIAITLVLVVRPRGLLGMIMATITIGLFVAGMFLGEGLICLVMAAPILFFVGLLLWQAVRLVDWLNARYRNRPDQPGRGTHVLLLLPFLLLSLEGVRPELSFPRHEAVVAERVLEASAGEVEAALAEAPRFEATLPPFLQLGFPRPVGATGAGLAAGDRRVVAFRGGAGRPRDLVLEVAERGPGMVRFRATSDETRIAQWLGWQEAEVRWETVDEGRTRVRWTLRYERRLDPAWYFGPLERYGAGLAAAYLVEAAATPAGR